MKPIKRHGNIGKLVSTIIPDCILFGNKFFREWYDSNPYRRYEGNEDERRGQEINKDILVSKSYDSCLADARVVIVVDGSSTATKNNRTIYQYKITAYFDADKNCDVLNTDGLDDTLELSSDGKRASMSQSVLKSNLEKNYQKFTTVKDVCKENLTKVLKEAVKFYDIKKIGIDELFQQYYFPQQFYGVNGMFLPF